MSDMKAKTDEVRNKIADSMSAQQQKVKESFSNIQNQMQSYGDQIGDYLKTINADVEDYRFSVEKIDEGISINVTFKAIIKKSNGINT